MVQNVSSTSTLRTCACDCDPNPTTTNDNDKQRGARHLLVVQNVSSTSTLPTCACDCDRDRLRLAARRVAVAVAGDRWWSADQVVSGCWLG